MLQLYEFQSSQKQGAAHRFLLAEMAYFLLLASETSLHSCKHLLPNVCHRKLSTMNNLLSNVLGHLDALMDVCTAEEQIVEMSVAVKIAKGRWYKNDS